MSKVENSKKEELKKSSPSKKQSPAEKKAPAKKVPAKKAPAKSTAPSFLPKEILVFENKECIFVEKSGGVVIARLLDGGYVSGEESKFTSK